MADTKYKMLIKYIIIKVNIYIAIIRIGQYYKPILFL